VTDGELVCLAVAQVLLRYDDDYLPKPFAFAELVARIQALARRATPAQPATLVHGDLVLDPGRRIATRAGKQLALSPKEFALLDACLPPRDAS
jgi:DNA-binding response OmpR family regulator